MILAVGGDPGGSRALMPVLFELERMGVQYMAVQHGTLGAEFLGFAKNRMCTKAEAKYFLDNKRVSLVFWSSSNNDTYPLSVARYAAELKIPHVHLLDNWANYKARLETDGQKTLFPSAYIVMDEKAKSDAVVDGVNEKCLLVLGHPDLARLAKVQPLPSLDACGIEATTMQGKALIGYICEAYSIAFGEDCNAEKHPGFTEITVLERLAESLQKYVDDIYLLVFAHPKHDKAYLEKHWERVRGDLLGSVVKPPRGSDAIPLLDGVCGSASILLYEAWLLGIPMLSYIPKTCTMPPLFRFKELEKSFFASDANSLERILPGFIHKCIRQEHFVQPSDFNLHKFAPLRVAQCLVKMANLSMKK